MADLDRPDPAATVAIVGLACRVPGAGDAGQFWRNLREGVESVERFSREELHAAGVGRHLLDDPRYVPAGAVLEGAERFDADFFSYAPAEAKLIDPQQRVFLELVWTALEDAGYDPRCDGAAGVFAGSGLNTYLLNNLFAGRSFLDAMDDLQTLMAADKDFLATRVSYHLDLTGPSVTVQTACSTSLVAVAYACQSLLDHHCDVAVAGGVTVRVPQRRGYLYQPGGIFSPDGYCRPFDARAAGTVIGSGAGVVVLKRLADALADRDDIRAVVLGAAVDNDGGAKSSYTAPSVDGQARVIRAAHALAGVSADTIGYVEAHGTGTQLGDPIEVAGLTRAFRASTARAGYCAIGSVKSNLGHLDAAAGVTSLVKTVLALQHRLIPPTLNFSSPNPVIDFSASPFYVSSELREWPDDGLPPRAGVSSFGIGGTNAHVVLETGPAPRAPAPSRPVQLLVLSAKTAGALDRAAENLAEHLEREPGTDLASVACTLQSGRRAFGHRRAVACRDVAGAVEALRAAPPSAPPAVVGRGVAFLFPGQGSQRAGTGRELHSSEPVFREAVDRCSRLLEPNLGLDLRGVLWGPDGGLDQTALSQPAMFVLEYALAQLWASWGVRPEVMLGHSVGEYAAACLAGVFSLEDALRLVAARGRLVQSAPPGAMLAVDLPAARLEGALADELCVAAVNAPSMCVVSGPTGAIERLRASLETQGRSCRRLQTSHAFHSPAMDGVLSAFTRVVGGVELRAPTVPFVSNVTGRWITAEEATDPAYWAAHMRRAVQFEAGVREVLSGAPRVLLEVGPGRTLTALARAQLPADRGRVVASLPGVGSPGSELEAMVDAAGRLWAAGVAVDWPGFTAGAAPSRVALPTYPFEPRAHWVEAAEPAPRAAARARPGLDGWFRVPVWRQAPRPARFPASAGPAQPAWLVLADDLPFSARVVRRLRAGGPVVEVRAGGQTRLEGDVWSLDARDSTAYDLLVSRFVAARGPTARVLHLWSLAPGGASAGAAVPHDDPVQWRGFFSLMLLGDALRRQRLAGQTAIDVLTSEVFEVTGEEPLCPAKATLLGPCLVLPDELPSVRCRCIDVTLPAPGSAAEAALVDRVFGELGADDAGRPVALRGASRWVQEVEPLDLASLGAAPAVLRPRGVYLFTGGLGGISLTLARHVAASAGARIVLVGRTSLPPPGHWDGWLRHHPADDPTSERLGAIRALEAEGAEVLVLRADVTDRAQLTAAVDRAVARFGRVHGIVHAAGVWRGLPGASPAGPGGRDVVEEASRVLAPKVQGTALLRELAMGLGVDWVVLCSSLSSVLGGAGQADYAGANACLDAYAYEMSRAGVPTVSIGWDAWLDTGMTRRLTPDGRPRSGPLAAAISADEGAEAFTRALGSGLPRVLVSTRELWARSEGCRARPADLPDPAAAPPAPAPSDGGDEVERVVAAVCCDLLGLDAVGPDDDFFDLGGHSLLATRLLNALRERCAVEIPLRRLFERPTMAGIAGLVRAAGPVGRLPREGLSRQGLSQLPRVAREAAISAHLRVVIAAALGVEPERLAGDGELGGYDSAGYEADVLWAARRDFGVPLYPVEVRDCRSVTALAAIIASELEPTSRPASTLPGAPAAVQVLAVPGGPEPPPRRRRSRRAVFVLCAPRSGSTLFRLLLAGHRDLFCPPELWLLGTDSMAAWARTRFADLAWKGLAQAFASLRGTPLGAAEALVADLVARDVAVGEVFDLLQEDAAPRVLVDKTPGYALDAVALRQAEELFDHPLYLHLTRDPADVVESFVRNRFHRLVGGEGDPHTVAGQVWSTANRSAMALGAEVGPDRYRRVWFEDLVGDPRSALTGVCDFLGVPFQRDMLDPYRRGASTAGPGDPDIAGHEGIEAWRAHLWRTRGTPVRLDPGVLALATELGYDGYDDREWADEPPR